MILSPLSLQNPPNPFVPTSQMSIGNNLMSNISPFPSHPFEGTPIFLLPSNNRLSTTVSRTAMGDQPKPPPPMSCTSAVDTSKHFHVFVGDLSQEVDSEMLKSAFAQFGEISDAKIIKDSQSFKSKGYGFVSFVNMEDAEKSINEMNGQMIGRKAIRTNWAARKPLATVHVSIEDVMNQTSFNNTTVYIGGISSTVTEEDITRAFNKFGNTEEIRLFKEHCYGFVRYDTKEAAASAIVGLNGSEICGTTVKCSWGKEKTQQSSKDNIYACDHATLLHYAAAANYLNSINNNYFNTFHVNQMTNFSLPHQQQHQYFQQNPFQHDMLQ